jgi:hypothetical protein
LAEAAEAGEPLPEALRHHLSGCRRCAAVYAEFLEGTFRRDTGAIPKAPADWIRAGERIAAPHPLPRVIPRVRHRRWVEGGAALLAVAAAMVIVVVSRPERGDAIPSSLRSALERQLQHDAQGSLLYADDLPPRRRGIRGNGSQSLTAADLERLVALYNRRPPQADAAFWLVAGYVGTNQLGNADPYLRESLDRFPRDPRFHNLAGIVAYKRNQLAEAEGHVRGALNLERDLTYLVNLALLRREQGAEGEATTLLEEAATRFPEADLRPFRSSPAAPPSP